MERCTACKRASHPTAGVVDLGTERIVVPVAVRAWGGEPVPAYAVRKGALRKLGAVPIDFKPAAYGDPPNIPGDGTLRHEVERFMDGFAVTYRLSRTKLTKTERKIPDYVCADCTACPFVFQHRGERVELVGEALCNLVGPTAETTDDLRIALDGSVVTIELRELNSKPRRDRPRALRGLRGCPRGVACRRTCVLGSRTRRSPRRPSSWHRFFHPSFWWRIQAGGAPTPETVKVEVCRGPGVPAQVAEAVAGRLHDVEKKLHDVEKKLHAAGVTMESWYSAPQVRDGTCLGSAPKIRRVFQKRSSPAANGNTEPGLTDDGRFYLPEVWRDPPDPPERLARLARALHAARCEHEPTAR